MDAPEVETEAAESAPQKRRGPWPLIIIVLAVTLIAVWLVPGEFTTDPEVTDDAAPPSLLEKAPPAPTVESTPEAGQEVVQPAVVDDRPGAKARTMIAQMRSSGELTLDDLVSAAATAQAAGDLPDAYLLYFYAAREGHGGAAMTLATHADPAHHTPGESLFEAPDLVQAHKWYEAAANHGNSAARQALDALRARVNQMAADGDPAAKRLALMWQ